MPHIVTGFVLLTLGGICICASKDMLIGLGLASFGALLFTVKPIKAEEHGT